MSHPPPRKLRRVLRLAGWNALLLMIGLALIGLAGEVWIRQTVPFATVREPRVFVPGVGLLWPPDTEVRWTNMLDFWTVQRTNRLGFLDREPPSPERAAESCHIAVIGDSFVEALSVSIAEKFHVRLEETAAPGAASSGHYDLGIRSVRHRPDRTVGLLRRVRTASAPQAGRARLRSERLHQQLPALEILAEWSGPGTSAPCLRSESRRRRLPVASSRSGLPTLQAFRSSGHAAVGGRASSGGSARPGSCCGCTPSTPCVSTSTNVKSTPTRNESAGWNC